MYIVDGLASIKYIILCVDSPSIIIGIIYILQYIYIQPHRKTSQDDGIIIIIIEEARITSTAAAELYALNIFQHYYISSIFHTHIVILDIHYIRPGKSTKYIIILCRVPGADDIAEGIVFMGKQCRKKHPRTLQLLLLQRYNIIL